jgi:hypothetical protein
VLFISCTDIQTTITDVVEEIGPVVVTVVSAVTLIMNKKPTTQEIIRFALIISLIDKYLLFIQYCVTNKVNFLDQSPNNC